MGELQLEVDAKPSGFERTLRSRSTHSSDSTLDLNCDPIRLTNPLQSKIWTIFVSLLRSSNDLDAVEDAVKEVNSLYPPPPPGCTEKNSVWLFWMELIEIVKKVPYNHRN